jgi:hypothetical protein
MGHTRKYKKECWSCRYFRKLREGELEKVQPNKVHRGFCTYSNALLVDFVNQKCSTYAPREFNMSSPDVGEPES